MVPICEKVIRYDGRIIPTGSCVSVKLRDKQKPFIGSVGFIDEFGFVLDMSTSESAHTRRVNFNQVEKIVVMR